MHNLELEVTGKHGIHARPSAHLSKLFSTVKSNLGVDAYINENGMHCNTILDIMTLTKAQGSYINLVLNGERYQEAMDYILNEVKDYLRHVTSSVSNV